MQSQVKGAAALDRTPKKKRPPRAYYECAWCKKELPSPEAAEAHLQKKHDGNGYVVARGGGRK